MNQISPNKPQNDYFDVVLQNLSANNFIFQETTGISNKRCKGHSLPSLKSILFQNDVLDFQQRLDIDQMILRFPDKQKQINSLQQSQNSRSNIYSYNKDNLRNSNLESNVKVSQFWNQDNLKTSLNLKKSKTMPLKSQKIIKTQSQLKSHKKNHSADQSTKISFIYPCSDDNQFSKKTVNFKKLLIIQKTSSTHNLAKLSSNSSMKINDSITTNHDIINIDEKSKQYNEQILNKFQQNNNIETAQKYKIKSENVFKNFKMQKINKNDQFRKSDQFLKYSQLYEKQIKLPMEPEKFDEIRQSCQNLKHSKEKYSQKVENYLEQNELLINSQNQNLFQQKQDKKIQEIFDEFKKKSQLQEGYEQNTFKDFHKEQQDQKSIYQQKNDNYKEQKDFYKQQKKIQLQQIKVQNYVQKEQNIFSEQKIKQKEQQNLQIIEKIPPKIESKQEQEKHEIESSIKQNHQINPNQINSPLQSEIPLNMETDSSFFTIDLIDNEEPLSSNSLKTQNKKPINQVIHFARKTVKQKSEEVSQTYIYKNKLFEYIQNDLQLEKYKAQHKDTFFFRVIVQDYDTSQTKFERQISIKITQDLDINWKFNFINKSKNIIWKHQNSSQNIQLNNNSEQNIQQINSINQQLINFSKIFQISTNNNLNIYQNNLQKYSLALDQLLVGYQELIPRCFEQFYHNFCWNKIQKNNFNPSIKKQKNKCFHTTISQISLNYLINKQNDFFNKNKLLENENHFDKINFLDNNDFPNLTKQFMYFKREIQYQVQSYDHWIGNFKITIEKPFNILSYMIQFQIQPSNQKKNQYQLLTTNQNNDQNIMNHLNAIEQKKQFNLDIINIDEIPMNSINDKNLKFGQDKLIRLIDQNLQQQFDQQLKKIVNINKQMGIQENTLLIFAVAKGNLEIIKSIINLKPNLEIKNLQGNTALMISGLYQNEHVFQYLIQHGADQTSTNNDGENVWSIWNFNNKSKYKIIFNDFY